MIGSVVVEIYTRLMRILAGKNAGLGNNKYDEVVFDDKERRKEERNAKTRRDVTITLSQT